MKYDRGRRSRARRRPSRSCCGRKSGSRTCRVGPSNRRHRACSGWWRREARAGARRRAGAGAGLGLPLTPTRPFMLSDNQKRRVLRPSRTTPTRLMGGGRGAPGPARSQNCRGRRHRWQRSRSALQVPRRPRAHLNTRWNPHYTPEFADAQEDWRAGQAGASGAPRNAVDKASDGAAPGGRRTGEGPRKRGAPAARADAAKSRS